MIKSLYHTTAGKALAAVTTGLFIDIHCRLFG